jgi:Uma2 family endonuclease
MSTPPKKFYTPQEYLELERKADHKSEYANGQIFAMLGASREHDRITFNISVLTGRHLQRGKCLAFTANMLCWLRLADSIRIRISP